MFLKNHILMRTPKFSPKSFILLSFILLITLPCPGQENDIAVNTDWDHERHSWSAQWITHPTAPVLDYGVFLFRNEFNLDKMPDSMLVYLSADNRYKLWVNGNLVTTGPAKGSFNYWRYETIDLAPWLVEGDNVLAAEVFNLGEYRPVALFSRQTAFIFQVDEAGDGVAGERSANGLNTPGNWKVFEDKAYAPIPVSGNEVGGYYVAGPTDRFEAGAHPWGWMEAEYEPGDSGAWTSPRSLGKGVGRGYMHGANWLLVPRNIPLMETREIRFDHVARSAGIEVPEGFLAGTEPLVVPGGQTVTILLDQGELTLGYPVLDFHGGPGSSVTITYAESLRNPDGTKGNRDQVDGKEIAGYHDLVLPDGGAHRRFEPLWLRTWRYVQLDITTGEDPLVLADFHGRFEAYPFEERGSFSSNNPLHDQIWDVGWRTARLCASETYMDCPYYEQLQYLGDTRIQALISLNVAGDDRLMRNALELANQSRMPEGLTLSRGPSSVPQVIPAFSLYWIDMIHDFYLYREDDDFLRQFLPGIEAVLDWFERRIDFTGMLGPLDWFNFADWTKGFMVGTPPGADLGHSALISLNYVYALDRASELFNYFGELDNSEIMHTRAREYRIQAERTRRAVHNICYDSNKKLMADLPLDNPSQHQLYEKGIYSQHTNIWGILTDAIPLDDQPDVMKTILKDPKLIPTTIYFRFYLFEALKKTGMADKYTGMLGSWERMLQNGLTTFQEGDYKDRSDCHAWSASPLYHFLSLVAGIAPGEPGFRSVQIMPALGDLKQIEAFMPHPLGTIHLQLERKGEEGIKGTIELPEGVRGTLYWGGYSYPLLPGSQNIKY
jgi:alpha-L-rhamnosidase